MFKVNYLALGEKGLNIQGLGLAGAASCSAALPAVRQPFPRAFGLAFKDCNQKEIKNQQENPRWQLGWLCWVNSAHPKDTGQIIKHFLAVFKSHSSLRGSYTHVCPTGVMRTRSGVLGLICAFFTYSSDNTLSPSISNIQRH